MLSLKSFKEEVLEKLSISNNYNEEVSIIAETIFVYFSRMLDSHRYKYNDYKSGKYLEDILDIFRDNERSKKVRLRLLIQIFSLVAYKLKKEYPYQSEFLVSRIYYRTYYYSWVLSFLDKSFVDFIKFSVLLLTIPWIWVLLTVSICLGYSLLYFTFLYSSFSDSLYSSITVFTSLGFSKFYLSNLEKFLVGSEVILGYFMLGILVSIITRKVLRW